MDLSELYRDIVETSPDGIWVIDLDGRTLYANPAIARIHRIPDADARLADRLRHPRRGRPRAVRRAPRRGARGPGQRRPRSRCSGCAATATSSGCSSARPPCSTTTAGRRALLHRYTDYTERRALIESLRASEDALADQVAQNNFMQAVASAANEAASLTDVLLQARSLVLLHDDWERARAFVPGRDGSGLVEPFYPSDEDREADVGDPFAAAELALAQRAHDEREPGLGRAPAHDRLPGAARRRGATPSWPSPRLRRCSASS